MNSNNIRSKTIPCLVVGALVLADADAFGLSPGQHSFGRRAVYKSIRPQHNFLHATALLSQLSENDQDGNNLRNSNEEVKLLLAQASLLRGEAAALESDQAANEAKITQQTFSSFDTDNNGEVSLEELRAGLEKSLEMQLSNERVQALMANFDTSGDGVLRIDEFKSIYKFRSKLDFLAIEEQATTKAKAERTKKLMVEEAMMEAAVALVNERKPTTSDKILSVLPYLFPLMDGLQYGRFLLEGQSNPLLAPVGLLYSLYQIIPFSGFILFFALSSLSNNTKINRLVRFNMQQAIFVDIALFFPGILFGLSSAVFPASGNNIPTNILELPSNVVFGVLLATLTYCTVSSLRGKEPNKLPILSKAVLNRVPTLDMMLAQEMDKPKGDDDDDKE